VLESLPSIESIQLAQSPD